MRRIISLSAILALLFVGISCKKEAKNEVARKGYVNFVNGDVKLISKSGEAAAKTGDEVIEGMKIKTIGAKSFVDIFFGENAIKVLGDTEVEVRKLVTNIKTNGEDTTLFVGKGKLFSKVAKKLSKDDSYQVKTPTTTAGVRGTNFLVKEENGKSNVACLDGQLAVLNNSMPDSDPVVVNKEKECDVTSDKAPMVKDLSDENRKAMQNILQNIRDMQKEIWDKMRQQREEIKKYVEDQKEKDRTMLEKQKEGDKAMVEDQKARDREMIEKAKGDIKDKNEQMNKETRDKMDAAKNVNKDAAKDAAIEQKNSMKPDIKKFKVNKDQFKKQ